MAVSHIRLWKLMLDKYLKKTDLKAIADISNNTLAKLSKDERVSMENLERRYVGLGCNIEDDVELVKD